MEQEIKVSVICNVYNHEAYVRDALEGFVCQKTTFPFEVLVHDDASTDKSAEIIREYEERYPELIKPIYQTLNQYSRGGGITKRFQLPRVKGKYIAICEGDDYWTDSLKLQKQFDFMEENSEYSMCVCSTVWLNMLTGKQENRTHIAQDVDIPLEDIILEKHGRMFQLASVFMKTDVWKEWPEWRRAFPIGDLPLAILAALNGKVRMLSDTMTVYRWYTPGSWTARMDDDQRRAKVGQRMIEGLTKLNEATEYQYDAVIRQRIKRQKYTLALMNHDLKAIQSEELRDIYNSAAWYNRLAVQLRCRFPKLYARVVKPLGRITQKSK